MIDSRLLAYDPLTGVETIFHYDDAEDTFTLEDRQTNVRQIVEQNVALANAARSDWKGDFHHVASLPLVVLHDLKKRGILDDAKAFRKWLNEPDNRVFRTKGGRV